MSTYSEKLKDPRWQKKRLDILNRDEFTCQWCTETTKTLHVHHLKYSGNPWDAEDKFLLTLCEDCHFETKDYSQAMKSLEKALKSKAFMPLHIEKIAKAIEAGNVDALPFEPNVDIVCFLFENDFAFEVGKELYFESLRKKYKEKDFTPDSNG